MSEHKSQFGFTLFESLIAITVGVTLLGLVLGIYTLTIRSLNNGQDRSELTQNSRIVIERITRDIRETNGIATALPPDSEDPPAVELELEDGHSGILQYIRYYISSGDIYRQIRQYSFAAEPAVLVPYDAEDEFGNSPDLAIIENNKVGSNASVMTFYGNNLIYVDLTLIKRDITHTTHTAVYGRNL